MEREEVSCKTSTDLGEHKFYSVQKREKTTLGFSCLKIHNGPNSTTWLLRTSSVLSESTAARRNKVTAWGDRSCVWLSPHGTPHTSPGAGMLGSGQRSWTSRCPLHALSASDSNAKKWLVSSELKGGTQLRREGRSQGKDDPRQGAALESALII